MATRGRNRNDDLLKLDAVIVRVDRNGWGTADVTKPATHTATQQHARPGDTIAISSRSMKKDNLKLQDPVHCFVVKNKRGRQQWFAVTAGRSSQEKPDVLWEAWQVFDGITLPNTEPFSDHQTAGCQWGLACWKCGSAKVTADQIHQIKNSSVWTNTDKLLGTYLDPKREYNKFKRCHTQSVRCSTCKRSLGSHYAAPYYDSDTKTLTKTKVFPCVKLTTLWAKQGLFSRCAMVLTGPSQFEVEDALANIPCVDGECYAGLGRLTEDTKRWIGKINATSHKFPPKANTAEKMISFNVRMSDGTVIPMCVAASTSIATLKSRLAEKCELEPQEQILVFEGLELLDTDSLVDYDAADTVLYLCTRGPQTTAPAPIDNDTVGDRPGVVGALPLPNPDENTEDWKTITENRMRILLGASYSDLTAVKRLAAGCEGAVFEATIRDIRVALKVMFNYGHQTLEATIYQRSEYAFLQRVPPHRNIVAVLGVIQPSPLPKQVADLLPEETQELVSEQDVATGRKRYRSTTGILLEYLPETLQAFVTRLGRDMTSQLAVKLGCQIVAGVAHLTKNGVVHGDMKLNNVMVDTTDGDQQPRIVLVDFGCAVLRGPGQKDLDDNMSAFGTSGNAFALGNMAHIAPEVHVAFGRQRSVPRDSNERVEIPLRHQGAFAAGLLLFELAMGLTHPLPEYPGNEKCSEAEFEAINFATLRQIAGVEYAEVVKGLVQFKVDRRMPLDEAHQRLTSLL